MVLLDVCRLLGTLMLTLKHEDAQNMSQLRSVRGPNQSDPHLASQQTMCALSIGLPFYSSCVRCGAMCMAEVVHASLHHALFKVLQWNLHVRFFC